VPTLAEFREKQAKKLRAYRVELMKDEVRFIAAALDKARGNLAEAARALDVSDQALQTRVNLLKLRPYLTEVRRKYGFRQPTT